MQSLYDLLLKSGLNCNIEKTPDSIDVYHFLGEKVSITYQNEQYKIESGVQRHILLAIILCFLAIIMTGNSFATGLISALMVYSVIQVIRKTMLESVLHTAIVNTVKHDTD